MPLKYFQWGNFWLRSSYFLHPPLLFDKLCDIILYLFAVYLITGRNQRFQAVLTRVVGTVSYKNT